MSDLICLLNNPSEGSACHWVCIHRFIKSYSQRKHPSQDLKKEFLNGHQTGCGTPVHSGTSGNILVEGKEGFHQSHTSMHKHVLRDKGELADYYVFKTKQITLLALWENQKSFLLPSKLGIEEDYRHRQEE